MGQDGRLVLQYLEFALEYESPEGKKCVIRPTEADAARGALDLHALGLRKAHLNPMVSCARREYAPGDRIQLNRYD